MEKLELPIKIKRILECRQIKDGKEVFNITVKYQSTRTLKDGTKLPVELLGVFTSFRRFEEGATDLDLTVRVSERSWKTAQGETRVSISYILG